MLHHRYGHACWTRCERQRLASIIYRRGFLRLGAPVSPHRLPIFSISHLQRVSCPASGRLPPSRRYPRSLLRPALPSDFRPISITPVLSRSLERFHRRSSGSFFTRHFFIVSITRHQRSVCVQTVRFDDGRHRCNATYRTLYADRQRFRQRVFAFS